MTRLSLHPMRPAGIGRVFHIGTRLRQGVTVLALLTLTGLQAVQARCPAHTAPLLDVLPGIAVHHGHWPARHQEAHAHWATSVVLWQGREATVLDPGPSACAGQALERALQARGTLKVTQLINSHAHAEQVLANSHWRLPVAATAGTQASMKKRCPDCLAAMRNDLGAAALVGTRIVWPDHVLREGDVLQAGGRRWQVLEMPMAHTQSDLVLWSPEDGVLLAGGLLDGQRLVLAQGRVQGWLDALDRIAALKPRWLIGQHRVAGPEAVPQALHEQRQALCTLVRSHWKALDAWKSQPEPVPQQAPPSADEARQQHANRWRAWREMEERWMAGLPMPAACGP